MNGNRVLNVEIVDDAGKTQKKTNVDSPGGHRVKGQGRSKSSTTLRATCDAASQLVVVWFWATLVGTFYCAVAIVLPVLYSPESCLLLPLRLLAVVVLLEILVNWLCVRFVTSSCRPEVDRTSRDRERPTDSGSRNGESDDDSAIEIDLGQLRAAKCRGSVNGTTGSTFNGLHGSVYSLPVSGMRSLGSVERAWRRGDTIYVVSGRGDDGATVFDPAAAAVSRWNDGSQSATGCRKVVYPYWSSKPCALCRHRRPPRAHHCRYCGTCVLKRDHHCLLVGRCVGVHNQRHFIVFVFWSAVALALSFSHGLVYALNQFIPRNSPWDLLLPVTVFRVLVGGLEVLDAAMVALFYSLGWFLVASVRFAREQWRVVRLGITSFELDHHIKITNFNSVGENVRGVFGAKYWPLNFLVPLHWLYPATDDPVRWPNIKA